MASGCLCWNKPSTQPETFGWQPDYTVEGKILGQYISQKFKGQKIAIFAQGDDFGHDGVAGLQREVPAGNIATIQYYDPTNTNVAPQVQKLAQSGAKIVVSFTVPAFTALLQLTALRAALHAAARRQQRRLRPEDAVGPADVVLEGEGTRSAADPGHHHRRLPLVAG